MRESRGYRDGIMEVQMRGRIVEEEKDVSKRLNQVARSKGRRKEQGTETPN